MSLQGQKVQIPTVRLYRDSEGNGPGQIVQSGIYLCTYYNPGSVAPIHIDNLGCVKCYPTGHILTSYPSIYVCDSNETFKMC